MSYLIYDEEGELIDVIDVNTPEELKSYKQLNPQHNIELAKDIEHHFLIENDNIEVNE